MSYALFLFLLFCWSYTIGSVADIFYDSAALAVLWLYVSYPDKIDEPAFCLAYWYYSLYSFTILNPLSTLNTLFSTLLIRIGLTSSTSLSSFKNGIYSYNKVSCLLSYHETIGKAFSG